MRNFVKTLSQSTAVLALLMPFATGAQAQSCNTYSATVEAVGLDAAKELATDTLFGMIASDGAQVTMTSTVFEPSCYFTEVGNNVNCTAEAKICP